MPDMSQCISCKKKFTIKTLTLKNRNGKCGKCFNLSHNIKKIDESVDESTCSFDMNEMKEALNIKTQSIDLRECIYCKKMFDKHTGGMYIQPYIERTTIKNIVFSNDINNLNNPTNINTPICKIINYDLYKCKKCINNITLPEYINGCDGNKYLFTYPIKVWFEY